MASKKLARLQSKLGFILTEFSRQMPAVFPSLMVAIVGYNGGLKWPSYFLDNYLLMEPILETN
jgi:hypothetical protein